MEVLCLSGNQLQGELPGAALADIKSLVTLDLSDNEIQGMYAFVSDTSSSAAIYSATIDSRRNSSLAPRRPITAEYGTFQQVYPRHVSRKTTKFKYFLLVPWLGWFCLGVDFRFLFILALCSGFSQALRCRDKILAVRLQARFTATVCASTKARCRNYAVTCTGSVPLLPNPIVFDAVDT